MINQYGQQYCIVCKQWKSQSEFHNESKDHHGNRDWCKKCVSEYQLDRNKTNRKQTRKAVEFWNEHHPYDKIPMPKSYKTRKARRRH